MLVERVFLVSGVVKTVFSPNKKNKRSFFFFLVAGEHNYRLKVSSYLRPCVSNGVNRSDGGGRGGR